ncbi:response regulator [Candidatus Nitrosocosmicus arcticus]|uniref:Putative signal transduction response regulator, reiver domain n=1 Tax=Candidatus Nitrosocosmicus arcticus TaxID=2035267 RepID=A0A557SZ21_9ARCH|nr:response regulator [Candidatus Nitrosocosmicus arcticus]TVP41856.1 putative signal transduction response regulator, reiver domain [Candidatus Nitrosocosmicus arcticus]
MSTPPIVMVVDDDEELAYIFGELLKRSGFNTVSFTDPLLALKYFNENPREYWLVIADLKMPNLNGIDLAKKIRYNSSTVKILLITGFFDDEYLNNDDFKEARISEVLHKPVKLKELQRYVHELCYSM